MPTYNYEAIDKSGAPSKGTVTASNEKEALMDIRQRGLFTTSLSEGGGAAVGEATSSSELKKSSKRLLNRLLGGMGNGNASGFSLKTPSGGKTPDAGTRTKTKTVRVQKGFKFKAVGPDGKPVSGVLASASTEEEAATTLRKQGLFPESIKPNVEKEKTQVQLPPAKKKFKRTGAFFGTLKKEGISGIKKAGDDLLSAIPGGQTLKKAVKAARGAGSEEDENSEEVAQATGEALETGLERSIGKEGEGPPLIETLAAMLEVNSSGFALLHDDLINLGEKLQVLVQAQLDAKLDNKELMNEMKKRGRGAGAGAAGGTEGDGDDGDGDDGGFGMMDALFAADMLRGRGGRGRAGVAGGTKGTKRGTRARRRAVKKRAKGIRRAGRGRFGRIGQLFSRAGGVLKNTRVGGTVTKAGGAVGRAGGAVGRAGGAIGRAGGTVAKAGGAVGGAMGRAGSAIASKVPGSGTLGRGAAKVGGKALRALGPLGLLAGAGMGAFFEGGDAKQRALASGASEGQANAEMIGGGALGALDAFNPVKLITMFAPEDSMLGRAHENMSVENQLEGVKALGDSSTYRQIASTLSFGMIESGADQVARESDERLDKVRKRGEFFRGLIAAADGNEGRAQLAYYKALLSKAEKSKASGESNFSLQYFKGPKMNVSTDDAIERLKGSVKMAENMIAFDEEAGQSVGNAISTTSRPTQEMKAVAANVVNRSASNEVENITNVNSATTMVNSPSNTTQISSDGGGNSVGDSQMNEPSFRKSASETQRANMF